MMNGNWVQQTRWSFVALACLAALTMFSSEAAAQPSSKPNEITFDDIKFDIEKDGEFKREMLTKKIEDLHDQKVRIRGWILPTSTYKLKGFKEFVLVRDNMECCFGPGSAIYDCITIEMEGSAAADFTTRPIAVEGIFRLKEFKIGERLYAIYHIDATAAK